ATYNRWKTYQNVCIRYDGICTCYFRRCNCVGGYTGPHWYACFEVICTSRQAFIKGCHFSNFALISLRIAILLIKLVILQCEQTEAICYRRHRNNWKLCRRKPYYGRTEERRVGKK